MSNFTFNRILMTIRKDPNSCNGEIQKELLPYLCRIFSKQPKTIFVLRKNQLSLFYCLCGIAYFYIARKWF
jgi:hypothetical protein